MSTFRQDMTVTLDGEPYKVQTCAADNMDAEIAVAKGGGTIESRQFTMAVRIAFSAFKRTYPDHPLSASFSGFHRVLDDIDRPESEHGEPDLMDPTQLAAGDD